MVASYNTVEAIYRVVRKHVTDDQMKKIIDDLLQIPGNQSFKQTISRLAARRMHTVETCTRCGILIRPSGDHHCGTCGRLV